MAGAELPGVTESSTETPRFGKTPPPGKRRPRKTQAERTALSERRILSAARRLIARQGYTKTTLAQVGEASGYSRGLVSHRFGSKEGLLRELVARITSRFLADQIGPSIGDRSGLDALCAMVDTYMDELVLREERLRTVYVLMGEALGPVPEIRDVFANLNSSFRASAESWIKGGMGSGGIRGELNASAEAALFIGMLRGVAVQWVTDPGCVDLAAMRASLKDVLRRHLAAVPQSEG